MATAIGVSLTNRAALAHLMESNMANCRLISTVGLIKVYRDPDLNEYQCVHPDNPRATYFTDDPVDAMESALAMDRELIHEDVVRMVELA